METLGKIFGSTARVKIMRLFLFNPKTAYALDDVITRSRVKKANARTEINALTKIGFLRKKTFTVREELKMRKKDTKPRYKKVKKQGWVLDSKFPLMQPLTNLLLDSELINEKDMKKRISKAGAMKLILVSGLFLSNADRKLDLLIVGERIKKDVLEKEIAVIESEIGKELRYAAFSTEEFKYRLSMYDKLVRDTIENEYRLLVQKIEL